MIDQYSKETFENALPVHNKTGEKLWEPAGFIQGEFCYNIVITHDIKIHIRSSIDQSGFAASTGEDSIRAWLINGNGEPLGSKVNKYTTRVPGWNNRLKEILRTLWGYAQKAGYCARIVKPP